MVTDEATRSPGSADASLLAAVFEESPVATLRTTVADGLVGRILEANAAAHRLLGHADLQGLRVAELVVAGSLLTVGHRPSQHLLRVAVPAGLVGGAAVRWIEATLVPLSAAASPGKPAALVLLHDVTERRAHEGRRERAPRQDPLTGLADRGELMSRLASLSVATDGPFVAALFLDLDRFKRVNDVRGHAAGDELLLAVAARVRSVVRPADMVARVGGDEFVVLCPALADPDDARAIADRVLAVVGDPLAVNGRSMRVTASIGVATAAVGATDPRALLHAADAAMYVAKQAGRNRVAVAPARQPAARRLPGLRWGSRRRLG